MAEDKIVWIDCEMTGLDPQRDELIEIAAQVTGFDLEILDDGIDIVIKPSEAALAGMSDFVRNMHTQSGLLDVLDSGVTIPEAEQAVMEYITSHVPTSGKAPLGGNSVGTDKQFLQLAMPHLVNHLHYRIIDVSTIKILAKQWYPRVYFQAPEKHGGHRALGDIRDSIRELRYYRQLIFHPTGPSTEEAKACAQHYSDC